MNKKALIMTFIILIFAAGIRIHYITQKQGFHMDEVLSRVISTGNVGNLNEIVLNNNTVMYGKDVKELFFGTPQHSLSSDLYNLRLHNNGDDAHPSLYYSMLRIALNLSDYTPQGFIYAGCGLNMILFFFSFFIMRLILIRLFGDNKLVPIGLAIAFLNTGTISMTLFIRPYELQMLGILLISYIYLLIGDKVKNNILDFKDIISVVLSLTFVFWSGYFLIFYTFLLGCILLWNSRANLKNILLLVFSVFTAFGLVLLLNLSYFQLFYGQRFETVANSKIDLTFYLINFISYFCNIIKYLFYFLIIPLIILCVILGKNKTEYKGLSLVICSIIWSVFVAIISPFPVLRYIAPVFPILSIIIIYLLRRLNDKEQKVFAEIFVLVYALCSIFPSYNESSDTGIAYDNSRKGVVGGIENLFLHPNLAIDETVPVLIQSKLWHSPLYIFSTLNDSQKYIFRQQKEDILKLSDYPSEHFYIFIDLLYQNLYSTDNLNIRLIGKFLNYKCYEVRLTKTKSGM